MFVTFDKRPVLPVKTALKNLTRNNLPKKEISRAFIAITSAVRKEPEQAFELLGKSVKNKTPQRLDIAEQNIREVPFYKTRLKFASVVGGLKLFAAKGDLGVYKSVENIQKKYPKMINFLTNLIMN
jgi:hypothetical protein